MKKLMIMAVVASAAVAAQATAYFKIQSSTADGLGTLYNGKGSSSTALGGHSVYVLRYFKTGAGCTADSTELLPEIVSAFRSGTLSEDNITSYNSTIASYQTVLKTESNGRFDTAQTFAYDAGVKNTNYGFMLVAFNDSNIYVGDSYMEAVGKGSANLAQKLVCGFGNSDKTITNQDSFDYSGCWYAVPEPTSGILMLLGLAGLALKRKRA